MIWLFEFDDKFWGDKSKVDTHYLFDENDINFDMNLYDISLYMGTKNYFLLNDTNPDDIYYLQYSGINVNPSRLLIGKNTDYYNVIKNYYMNTDNKSTELKDTDKNLHISDVINSILSEVEITLQELEKIHENTHRYQNILQGKIYGYMEVRDIIKKYCS